MRRNPSLSTKLGAIGGVLLLMALASNGLTLRVTWQLEGGAAAVEEAGRMRMQTWRLSHALAADDSARLQSQLDRFDKSLVLLRNGDPSRPLFVPRDAESQRSCDRVQQGWQALRTRWAAVPAPIAAETALQADTHVPHIDAFVTAIETQLARWTAPLNASALYKAAACVATATSLDDLAQGFARQVRRVARADASAVRWSDESNRRCLLLASDCLPQQVVDAEACVPADACFCGQPQGDAMTRVIAIYTTDAAKMTGHCERSGFETMLGVPVRLHEPMVGELNLFYRSAATLDDENRTPLDDGTLLRRGLKALLAGDAGEAQRQAAALQPDVILLDNHLPGVSGVGALAELHEVSLGSRMLMLTVSEHAILAHIARGASNKEIARALNIAETTVKIHVQHILRKLELSSRVQAAVYATARTG